MNNQYILLNPGPVNLDDRVRKRSVGVDLCHRQSEFMDILMEVKRKLLDISEMENSYVSILHGSGSLAVESSLQTLVEGKVLVINNGFYCERIYNALLNKYGVEVHAIDLKMGEYPSVKEIEVLCNKNKYDWITMVHHETSTGILNPIEDICNIGEKYSIKIFVDAVSSFGAHPVDRRADVICFNSNKCLESIPGAAIVIWKKELSISRLVVPYFNLYNYIEDKIPSTPNTNAIVALDTALDILIEEDRHGRYQRLAAYIREVGSKYFDLFLKDNYSNVLTSFLIDRDRSEKIHQVAKDNGFILYDGVVPDQFRICNLGSLVNEKEIERLFNCLKNISNKI